MHGPTACPVRFGANKITRQKKQNDLTGVAGKVFDDVKDRREHGRLASLDCDSFAQSHARQRAEDANRIGDRAARVRLSAPAR